MKKFNSEEIFEAFIVFLFLLVVVFIGVPVI